MRGGRDGCGRPSGLWETPVGKKGGAGKGCWEWERVLGEVPPHPSSGGRWERGGGKRSCVGSGVSGGGAREGGEGKGRERGGGFVLKLGAGRGKRGEGSGRGAAGWCAAAAFRGDCFLLCPGRVRCGCDFHFLRDRQGALASIPFFIPTSFPIPLFLPLPPLFPAPFPLPLPLFSAPFSLLPCPCPNCCWGSCIWDGSCPRLGLFCFCISLVTQMCFKDHSTSQCTFHCPGWEGRKVFLMG